MKPMLCSIGGQCRSIGLEIALMCDVRVIEDSAVVSFSNRKLGIPLLNDGPKRLANLIGVSRATDIVLFDNEINARDAVDMGIAVGPVKNGTGQILYSHKLNTHVDTSYLICSFFFFLNV